MCTGRPVFTYDNILSDISCRPERGAHEHNNSLQIKLDGVFPAAEIQRLICEVGRGQRYALYFGKNSMCRCYGII